MIGCRKPSVDTEYLIEVFLNIWSKLSSSIREEGLEETVMFPDISVVGISSFFYLSSNRGDKMPYFSKAVDEDENISIYNTYKGAR